MKSIQGVQNLTFDTTEILCFVVGFLFSFVIFWTTRHEGQPEAKLIKEMLKIIKEKNGYSLLKGIENDENKNDD